MNLKATVVDGQIKVETNLIVEVVFATRNIEKFNSSSAMIANATALYSMRVHIIMHIQHTYI